MPAPNTPTDLIDRIRALERQVSDLAGRVNIRPALNTIVGGSVTIKDGGSLLVQDTSGDNVLSIGRVSPDVDGEPQMATVIRRMDGSLAFAVWTAATTGIQPVRMYDRNSNIIIADETSSAGGGLAIPYLPYNVPQPIQRSGWGTTASTTYAAVLRTTSPIAQPKMYIQVIQGAASGSTATGQLRVMVNGVQMVEGANGDNIDGTFDVPNYNYPGFPLQWVVEVQAKVTGGTGTMAVSVRSCYGRQS
ncbi:hypothetical protein SEA_KEANU_26 [Streptomyces phage Keanu]|nr:hypothetical protein SEA_KEANU_26 [Streptomyces phage Keanu]